MAVIDEPIPGSAPTFNETQEPSSDLEKQPATHILEKLDIEHAVVEDDPRNWSSRRKAGIIAKYSCKIH